MTAKLNLLGQRFGMLLVVAVAESSAGGARWLCKCDCGGESTPFTSNLRRGLSASCGCVAKLSGKRNAKHGMRHSKEYEAWKHMRRRCNSPRDPTFHLYGGRGIRVCERWANSFEQFFADMGAAPSPKHSIDRIDVNGNYEPSNCRWATSKEQNRNRRNNLLIEHGGQTQCLAAWCEQLGLSYSVAQNQLSKRKMSVEQVFGGGRGER